MGINARQNDDGSMDLVNDADSSVVLKVAADGSLQFSKPAKLQPYAVADVPDAADHTGAIIYVPDGAAGSPILAYSDGTDWLRSDTGAAVAAA